jgi:hypothetical protein
VRRRRLEELVSTRDDHHGRDHRDRDDHDRYHHDPEHDRRPQLRDLG